MPRPKRITQHDASVETADNRRSVDWYEVRHAQAAGVTRYRTDQYRAISDELNRLLSNVPNRAQIRQLWERGALAFARLAEAGNAETDARAQLEKRIAEDTPAVVPDAPSGAENVTAEQSADNSQAPEPAAVA